MDPTYPFDFPVHAVAAPANENDLFVVEKNTGQVLIVRDGAVVGGPAAPFEFVKIPTNSPPAQNDLYNAEFSGLTGLAFHPDWDFPGPNEGRFFVLYTRYVDPLAPVTELVVVEYLADPNDVTNASAIVEVGVLYSGPYPGANHQGGTLAIATEGSQVFAYIGTGDGDSGGAAGWRAQDLGNLYGKMLRLELLDGSGSGYITSSNWAGNPPPLQEIWAWGFRNPYRFDVDPVTGSIWIGDVAAGGTTAEEVNVIPLGVGGLNFGWDCLIGQTPGPATIPANCTGVTIATTQLPIWSYPHAPGGTAIIGGVVYRGIALPEVAGHFFVGDYVTRALRSVLPIGQQGTTVDYDYSSQIAPVLGASDYITGIGADGRGEMYITVTEAGALPAPPGPVGKLYRVEEACVGIRWCSPASPNSIDLSVEACAVGSESIADADLTLVAWGVPDGETGLLFMSESFTGPQPIQPGAGGPLCIGGTGNTVYRFVNNILQSGEYNEFRLTLDFGQLPNGATFDPGETWFFQFFYRDTGPGPGVNRNYSDVVSVTFQ